MKKLAYFLCIVTLLISAIPLRAGRCTGSMNCSACSDCSRCAHCNSGGSCGVCSSRQQLIDVQKANELKEASDKILQQGGYADSLKQKADRLYSDGTAQTTTTHSEQSTKSDIWVIVVAVIVILFFSYKKLD